MKRMESGVMIDDDVDNSHGTFTETTQTIHNKRNEHRTIVNRCCLILRGFLCFAIDSFCSLNFSFQISFSAHKIFGVRIRALLAARALHALFG